MSDYQNVLAYTIDDPLSELPNGFKLKCPAKHAKVTDEALQAA